MAKRRRRRRPRILDVLLTGLLSLYLGFVCLDGTVGAVPSSWSEVLSSSGGPDRWVGPLGAFIGEGTRWAVGPIFFWLLPVLPWAWVWLTPSNPRRRRLRHLGWGILTVAVWSAFVAHPQWTRVDMPTAIGGAVGREFEGLLAAVVGHLGSFLALGFLSSWLLLRPLPPLRIPAPALDSLQESWGPVADVFADLFDELRHRWSVTTLALRNRVSSASEAWREERRVARADRARRAEESAAEIVDLSEDANPLARSAAPPTAVDPFALPAESVPEPELAGVDEEFRLSRDPSELLEEEEGPTPRRRRRRRDSYPLPTLDLLENIQKEERGFSREVLQMNARLLRETLSNYGITGQINEVRPGPVVTTFEFEPAAGVKVSQITSRADDLALAMRATRIRIEAPIPGKAAVGIEIPNPYPQMVGLKQVVGAIPEDGAEAPLAIAVGKDTEGSPFFADLSDMPHLLVAGATGSGKSVCVNAIICNLLLRNGPDRVRMLMIDPKMLELSVYNGIPHLMHPVITQPREALKAVKYMVAEMETRYALLARHGVRNIGAFNEKVRAGRAKDEKTNERIREPLPYCVLIIDELADLMMQLGSDLEIPIARLAQMARAVGIHLVLATQRPSVNVITGVIKANFPSRIAFRVISKIDSRTIIDGSGAEQLLGKGDMLILLAGMPQPLRVHGAFLSMEECERVVEYWMEYTDEPDELDLETNGNGPGGVDLGDDDLLDEARRMVILSQSGSTTMLQRRLRIGYTRASRLMDMLEAAGVVGENEGSKARVVMVSKEELEAEG
jgi:DNA segregation ATPase FtsK/SpoIIIE, S-DNA-T family